MKKFVNFCIGVGVILLMIFAYQTWQKGPIKDLGGGVLVLKRTGLMWQEKDDGQKYTWFQANGIDRPSVCSQLKLGGYTDWRLPTLAELLSITLKDRKKGPKIEPEFSNTKPDWYWTETTAVSNPEGSWSVDFSDGNGGYYEKTNLGYVRCVRGEAKDK